MPFDGMNIKNGVKKKMPNQYQSILAQEYFLFDNSYFKKIFEF